MLPSIGLRSFVKRSLGLGGRTSLNPGDVAPELDAVDARGKRWTLAELRGQRAVVYFYPKDDTPGCTREACDFRDQSAELGAVVLGVSTDAAASHTAFIQKYNLGFPLLADTDGAVSRRYGVLDGGVSRRATFVLDREGRLAWIADPVKVEGHVAAVKAAVEALP